MTQDAIKFAVKNQYESKMNSSIIKFYIIQFFAIYSVPVSSLFLFTFAKKIGFTNQLH